MGPTAVQTLRSRRRGGLCRAFTAPAPQPSSRHRRGRRAHRTAAQDPDQTRSRRRRRHHRRPSGHRPQRHECACHLHNLANLKASWLRHTPTAQTAPLLLETLLRRTAQPMLASRRHPLAPRPRRRRGNPQHHRRPLPPGHRQRGPPHHRRPRRDRDLHHRLHHLGPTGLGAHRQRRHLHRSTPTRWAHRPGNHPGHTGHQLPDLAALPSADLRNSRALPPNAKEMADRTPRGHDR